MSGGAGDAASPQAQAEALAKVGELETWLKAQPKATADKESHAHWAAALTMLDRFRKEPSEFRAAPVLATPPGQPIGTIGFADDDAPDFAIR